jgi:hypothetical protein
MYRGGVTCSIPRPPPPTSANKVSLLRRHYNLKGVVIKEKIFILKGLIYKYVK